MKYGDNTPIILNGINLTIHGQEVVGIVGRTGSGEWSVLGIPCPQLCPVGVGPISGHVFIQ